MFRSLTHESNENPIQKYSLLLDWRSKVIVETADLKSENSNFGINLYFKGDSL